MQWKSAQAVREVARTTRHAVLLRVATAPGPDSLNLMQSGMRGRGGHHTGVSSVSDFAAIPLSETNTPRSWLARFGRLYTMCEVQRSRAC